MLSLPGQDWEVQLLSWSSVTESPPQEQKLFHSIWRPSECKPLFLGLALKEFEVNHWITALAAVTGCCSRPNSSVLQQKSSSLGRVCPHRELPHLPLVQQKNSSHSLEQHYASFCPLKDAADNCHWECRMKYHIVYEVGNREWI